MTSSNIDLIIERALAHGVDPGVALALAQGEGGLGTPALDGDIGYGYGADVPTSFGPFQLHWHGACPKRLWGNVAGSRNWCNSRDGIDYALALIAGAGATTAVGYRQAIANAVRNFERPAKPQPEIDRDIAWYDKHAATFRPPAHPPAAAFPAFPGDMDEHQGNGPSIDLLQMQLVKAGFLRNGNFARERFDDATGRAVQKLKETHDVLMFLGGHNDLADYWGRYVDGVGTWDTKAGQRTWSFLAWLAAIRKAQA